MSTEDERSAAERRQLSYDDREVNVRGIVWFTVAITASLVLAGGLGVVMVKSYANWAARHDVPPSPLAAEAGPQLPPPPRLQTQPERELRALLAAEDSLLRSYGWVDPRAGIARIPIDDALAIVAQHGLPTYAMPESARVTSGAPARPPSTPQATPAPIDSSVPNATEPRP